MVAFLPILLLTPCVGALVPGSLPPVTSVPSALTPAWTPQEAAPSEDLGDERRILTLAGEVFVRGRTRLVSGTWQVRAEGGWEPVDGPVQRVRAEADLLRQQRELERALEGRPGDDPARLEMVRWMLSEGLSEEGATALDALLEITPDDPRALGVAEGAGLLEPTRIRSVEAQQVLLKEGAQAGPLGRERVVRSLATLEEREGFKTFLASLLQAPSWRERALGHHLSRRTHEPLPWRTSVRAALLDPREEVRLEATRALTIRQEPRLLGPLLDGLDHEHGLVRRNAAAALGAFGHPAAVEPLLTRLAELSGKSGGRASFSSIRQRALLYDFDVEVAAGAAVADPSIVPVTDGVVLDVRILSSIDVVIDQERGAIRRALEQLTDGEERSTRQWLSFWSQEGEAWRMARHLPEPEAPSTPRRTRD